MKRRVFKCTVCAKPGIELPCVLTTSSYCLPKTCPWCNTRTYFNLAPDWKEVKEEKE